MTIIFHKVLNTDGPKRCQNIFRTYPLILLLIAMPKKNTWTFLSIAIVFVWTKIFSHGIGAELKKFNSLLNAIRDSENFSLFLISTIRLRIMIKITLYGWIEWAFKSLFSSSRAMAYGESEEGFNEIKTSKNWSSY